MSSGAQIESHEEELEGETHSTWMCLQPVFRAAFFLASVAVCAHPILVTFSDWHPALELLNHLCMHALFASSLLLAVAVVTSRRIMRFFLAMATLMLLALTSAWDLVPAQAAPKRDSESNYRVLAWNLLATNEHYSEIEDLVFSQNPDVIVLIEVRPGVIDKLENISKKYPLALHRPSWGGEGIAVLSRIPVTSLEFEDFALPKQPGIVARLPGKDATAIDIVAVHTLSPLPLERVEFRDQQLKALADWSKDRTEPIVACGDFNITPWTQPFKNLLAEGFVDTRAGTGNGPSWPAELGPFGIPIDHVLAKGNCRVLNRRVLPQVRGSDHCPVVFDVVF